MKGRSEAARLPVRHRRAVIIISALLLVALIAYVEVIHPNLRAKAYEKELISSSKPLENCFTRLADTTQLDVYYAPDVSLETKINDMKTIRERIADCRAELTRFDRSAHSLPVLRLAGYTEQYRTARVNQRQALDVVGQSHDVLNQYDSLAVFLTDYYNQTRTFLDYNADINGIDTAYISPAQQQMMAERAADLRQRAEQVRLLKSPAGFEDTKTATTDMFVKSADGMDALLSGYRAGNDYLVTTAFAQLDSALADYDAKVVNLPFEQLNGSYIPEQVEQLPGKIDNLLSGAAE